MALPAPPSGNTFRGLWPTHYPTLKKTTLKYTEGPVPATINNVKWLQQALMYGFNDKRWFVSGGPINLRIDGHFGSLTEGAVREFQTFCRTIALTISIDGIVGAYTWSYINAMVLGTGPWKRS